MASFCSAHMRYFMHLFTFHFRGEKSQNLARHMALVHNKLDELLADKQLVAARRLEQQVRNRQQFVFLGCKRSGIFSGSKRSCTNK